MMRTDEAVSDRQAPEVWNWIFDYFPTLTGMSKRETSVVITFGILFVIFYSQL